MQQTSLRRMVDVNSMKLRRLHAVDLNFLCEYYDWSMDRMQQRRTTNTLLMCETLFSRLSFIILCCVAIRLDNLTLLCVFAKLRKATISFATSVFLSIRKEQFSSRCSNFHEIRYFGIFLKSVDKFQFWLKSDQNNGHVTWRATI
jgi:hypothetical protein